MQNEQGDLGETIFKLAISRDYVFRPRDLGEKWPVSDFYVELTTSVQKLYFIVQVKSSRRGYSNGRLRITAPKAKINALKNYNAPTYLAGVDVSNERVYLVPVNKSLRQNISTLDTSFELTPGNLRLLARDVRNYWRGSNMQQYKRNYNHLF